MRWWRDWKQQFKEWREDRRRERARMRQIREAVDNFHKTGVRVYKSRSKEFGG